jgi:hypothetical protein
VKRSAGNMQYDIGGVKIDRKEPHQEMQVFSEKNAS